MNKIKKIATIVIVAVMIFITIGLLVVYNTDAALSIIRLKNYLLLTRLTLYAIAWYKFEGFLNYFFKNNHQAKNAYRQNKIRIFVLIITTELFTFLVTHIEI